MNILLVYGGTSCEHDISIITAGIAKRYFEGNIYCCYLDQHNKAYLVPNNVTPQQHKHTKYKRPLTFALGSNYITVRNQLSSKKIVIDCAVNCCHGSGVEDGTVAGLFNLMDIPIVGSGVVASGIAMSKIATKQILSANGIDTIQAIAITREQFCKQQYTQLLADWQYPLIVKPNTLGSSIGISVANDTQQLKESLDNAFKYDDVVLVERALQDFYELNCSCISIGDKLLTSNVEMPLSQHEILTFADKYLSGSKGMATGQTAPETHQSQVRRITKHIYRLLSMSGVVRVDYLVDVTTDQLYVNEINTIPGSLAYSLWNKMFTPLQFGRQLINSAIEHHQHKKTLRTTFESGVLGAYSGKK